MLWRSAAIAQAVGGHRPQTGPEPLPGASPPAPPRALPEPCRGRRLQRGRVRKWLLKNHQRLAGARPSVSEGRWGGLGWGARVARPGLFVAPSGDPGVGRGQRPDSAAALCG